MVDNDLYRHSASPDAGNAFTRICPGVEAAAATLPVYLQRGSNTRNRWGRNLSISSTLQNFQLCRFVELDRFLPVICYLQRFAGDDVTGTKAKLIPCRFADTDEERSFMAGYGAVYQQRVSQIGVALLVKGTGKPDPRLDCGDFALPGYFVGGGHSRSL